MLSFSRRLKRRVTLSRYRLLLLVGPLFFINNLSFAQVNSARTVQPDVSDPPINVGAGWSQFDWDGSGQPFDYEGAFTFTSAATTLLTVTDSFCPGDQFRIYDFGLPIGNTNPVAVSSVCTP